MKIWIYISVLALIFTLGTFHLFALMHLYPLYLSSPLLFIAIFFILSMTSHKKTFRGFK